MWVFTTAGFVSAVQHRANHDNVMVRARDKAALDNMLTSIELAGKALAEDGSEVTVDQDLEIVTSSKGDYRHRVTMSKSTFALFLQFEVLNYLSYPNFKSELAKYRGPEYTKAAHNVWDNMLGVSDGPQFYGGVDVGGKRIAKKYQAGTGSFVGSTFFSEGTASGSEDDWGKGYHGFNDGREPEYDAEDGPEHAAMYADSTLEEAEAEFGVLPEGSENWTEAEWEEYLDRIAPDRADVEVGNFTGKEIAKVVTKAEPKPKAAAKPKAATAAAKDPTPKAAGK